jgi:hypothetical protein
MENVEWFGRASYGRQNKTGRTKHNTLQLVQPQGPRLGYIERFVRARLWLWKTRQDNTEKTRLYRTKIPALDAVDIPASDASNAS